MAKLIEIINQETLQELYPQVQRALELTYDIRSSDPAINESGQFRFPTDRWDIAEPILRFYHSKMWLRRNKDGHFYGFIKTLLEDELKGVATDKQMSQLSSQIGRALAANHLVEKKAHSKWLIHPWPSGLTGQLIDTSFSGNQKPMTRKDQAETEKRIGEEADKPVTSVFDLKAIPLPKEETREAIVDYLIKVKKSYDKLCAAFQQEQQANRELEAELKKATSKLEEIANSEKEWNGIVAEIRETLGLE